MFRNLSVRTAAMALCLMSSPLSAGGPSGDLDSLEPFLRVFAEHNLDRYGYGATGDRGDHSEFTLKVKTFLWDHRDAIDVREVRADKLIETFFCVLKIAYDVDMPPEISEFGPWERYCADLEAGQES